MQRTLSSKIHLGIIMDGNGRWATARGLPRSAGHLAGVRAIRPVLEAATESGVGTLTLFAFASDNWRRPEPEVAALIGLLRSYLDDEVPHLEARGVRLTVIGRRDRLPAGVAGEIAAAEVRTSGGSRLHLRIAFDYSARDAILAAAMGVDRAATRADFARLVAGDDAPDVDLLIRTGGERRLSDFLLWECAYAELLFVERKWPDFGPADLQAALADFAMRERRYGAIPAAARAA